MFPDYLHPAKFFLARENFVNCGRIFHLTHSTVKMQAKGKLCRRASGNIPAASFIQAPEFVKNYHEQIKILPIPLHFKVSNV